MNSLRYDSLETKKLISIFRISLIFGVLNYTISLHLIVCHYKEMVTEYKLEWS